MAGFPSPNQLDKGRIATYRAGLGRTRPETPFVLRLPTTNESRLGNLCSDAGGRVAVADKGNKGESKWVIFDADNTLWDVEALYDAARKKFCHQVAEISGKSREEIKVYQRKTDGDLKATFGYSANRFARSFEETLKHFVPDPADEVVARVRKTAEGVFYKKAEVYPGLEDVLRALRAAGYNLGIVTAGEEWVQRRRIEEFHLRSLFQGVRIVEIKTKDVLLEFCKRNGVDRTRSYFVGDSVDSDVVPAHKAGLKPVLLLKHHHWQEGETKNVPKDIESVELNYVADLQTHLNLDPVDRPHVPRKVPAYGIFEGGGAKGLAHVGVLTVLEERRFELKAVAGTSAGALVAGLCAAGYTSDELYRDQPVSGGLLDFSYLDVLGKDEWGQAIRFISEMNKRLGNLINPNTGWVDGFWTWLSLGSYLNAQKESLASFNREQGYFSLEKFRDRYDGWLRDKLVAKGQINAEMPGPVRFKHLIKKLYIVSTDVTGKRLRVHSNETDPEEIVADVVAASIAIPAVFVPRDLGENGRPALHVDGGLLSNFPAWLFAKDPLSADPGEEFVPVFGIELQDREDDAPVQSKGLFGLAKDLVSTAVAGSKRLETRGMRRLLQIPVPVTVEAYAFDLDHDQRKVTYLEGKEAAKRFFKVNIHAVSPRLMQPYLADIHAEMLQALQRKAGRTSMHLRVNIMARVPPDEVVWRSKWPQQQQIEILYHYNMDLDPDVFITFGPEEGGVGACFKERRIQRIDLQWTRDAYYVYGMTAVQQALVRRMLKSLMCIPMYDPDATEITDETRIIGILNFDSEEDVLALFSKSDIRKQAIEMARMMANTWYDLAEKGETADG